MAQVRWEDDPDQWRPPPAPVAQRAVTRIQPPGASPMKVPAPQTYALPLRPERERNTFPNDFPASRQRFPIQMAPPPAPSGGYNADQLRNALMGSGAPANADSLAQFIAGHPEFASGVTIQGSKKNKLYDPSGNFLADVIRATSGPNPSWDWDTATGDSGGGGNYGNSQSTELFINTLLQRMEELQKPQEDPFRDLLQVLSLSRVKGLEGDPYTAGDDAALRARYMAPLTQARDTAQQQVRERIGARGMLPSSGLLEQSLSNIDAGYEQGVAQGSNDLAVRAIDEKQNRGNQQLDILRNLENVSAGARGEHTGQMQELTQLAAMFPQLDSQRLQQLLQASGEGATSPGQLASTALGIGNQQMDQQQINDRNRQATAAAWGEYLAYILSQMGR
jgi:hypothetical protein